MCTKVRVIERFSILFYIGQIFLLACCNIVMMSLWKYKGLTTMMSSRWLLKPLLQDLFSRHSLGSIARIGGGIRSLSAFWLWLPLSSSFYHITLSSIVCIKWAFDKITMSEYWERCLLQNKYSFIFLYPEALKDQCSVLLFIA